MVKSLTKHGNSYALVIDRAILELLQIDPERPVELSTDGNTLTIRPVVEGTKGSRVARSLKRINDRHGKALKRLGE
ncbi:MAG: AbrB/MazE/SpoVT family DNA-binding domain-containing protein [Phycisphaerales bacterium]